MAEWLPTSCNPSFDYCPTSQAGIDLFRRHLVPMIRLASEVLLSVTGVVMLVGLIYILDIELVLCLRRG